MLKKQSKKGVVFLVIGICLIIFAAVFCCFNLAEDKAAGDYSSKIIEELKAPQNQKVALVNGEEFCGTVVIEELGIELPVFNDWSYKKLKLSPCRYSGQVENNNIIIAAHNYKSHFGNLNKLQLGEKIEFVQADGTLHSFIVKEIVKLDGTDVTDMKSGEWDLTLFTCTKGGKQRVTVRCQRMNY